MILLAATLVAGCQPDAAPEVDAAPALPTDAVLRLAHDLRRNDLEAYARHAVPPALHVRLEAAWKDGRTIWPLTELPLDDQLPLLISTLAEPEAEKNLMATYKRQFAGAHAELRSAASTLGLFAAQYVGNEDDYGEEEREHYVQLIAAFSQWGQSAPLGDVKRAQPAIAQLSAAARQTGLAGPDAFAKVGMKRSLARLGPFSGRLKSVLSGYGLDLDLTLDSIEASLVEQTGDTARVRLQYTLAGHPIDAIVQMERRGDHWYLHDLLRHAEIEAGPVAAVLPDATPAPQSNPQAPQPTDA
jgi:hypothetical protein